MNPILYNVMSKRYREAFRETICNFQRKRTVNMRHSGLHQSYYSSRVPARAILRHQESRAASHVMRSDTIQTQVSLSLNGNSDEVSDPPREQLVQDSTQTIQDERSWTNSENKAVCCNVCVSEQSEVVPSPCYERLLVQTGSADSAC